MSQSTPPDPYEGGVLPGAESGVPSGQPAPPPHHYQPSYQPQPPYQGLFQHQPPEGGPPQPPAAQGRWWEQPVGAQQQQRAPWGQQHPGAPSAAGRPTRTPDPSVAGCLVWPVLAVIVLGVLVWNSGSADRWCNEAYGTDERRAVYLEEATILGTFAETCVDSRTGEWLGPYR